MDGFKDWKAPPVPKGTFAWKTLKADQEKHQKDPKDSKLFQGGAMRSFDGKAVAPCGSFRVHGKTTRVRLSVPRDER